MKAVKLHGVHSPFVFDLYQQVILHDGSYYSFSQIEAVRQEMLSDYSAIEVTDFGAGSKKINYTTRQISDIARTSLKPAKYGQLLFRLVNRFRPNYVFELGTSLGITTAYMASAARNAALYTFEGCPTIAKVARGNFSFLDLTNITQITGNLDETLQPQLEQIPQLDFAFFDGNHRYEPTMRYFTQCLAKAHEGSVFVMDDIYWSAEMKRAWKEIKQHPAVCQTIDLYFVGLVFFRTTQPKEHFTLFY
ncbi:class I SAM-dependent methyltransferase [Pontibacter sp. BT327]|uniref:Class I SAM-dependent methyltransferase n=2 Tax=Pontibacter burrus TaxID=2704466 RepID=A0A6B3LNN2_9BACT|nr:class I SAM-dependent methyltransferase [Pontibacter burrus]